jgi:hypothetical protein
MNAAYQPHIFSLDYERSLRAAFLFEDFKLMCREELPRDAKPYATFLSPMLTVIATRFHAVSPELKTRLAALRRALPRRYRHDLDDLRLFFRLGGLRSDPFK